LPLFLRIREPAIGETDRRPGLQVLARTAARRLLATYHQLRDYKHAVLMLLAFLAYNDGIGTIIRLAAIYGAEIGIESGSLIMAILVVQFVGIPCTILFGLIAGWIGTKRTIFGGLVVYLGITLLAYFLSNATQFFLLAIRVGMVQGGTQALSRSLFASMIPKRQATEFFAFFSLSEKFAGVLGPLLFAATVFVTGSSRNGILSVITFFVVGGLLLKKVDVQAGRQFAQRVDDREPE
jgi:UMF1 family MFS transporter